VGTNGSDHISLSHLHVRNGDLDSLRIELADAERELGEIQAGLRAFEARYLKVVGQRYAELEEIEIRMAELEGTKDSSADLDLDELDCGQTRFHSSERLKKLYREVARQCHPDLAEGESEREQRHELMVEVNRAYELGAEERLKALLDSGLSGGASDERELVRAQIALVRQCIADVRAKIESLATSETFRLMHRCEKAEAAGWDLLGELLSQVERQITKSRLRLLNLEGLLAHPTGNPQT